jgi:hypothetical protein
MLTSVGPSIELRILYQSTLPWRTRASGRAIRSRGVAA